jgi:hypothetical protein
MGGLSKLLWLFRKIWRAVRGPGKPRVARTDMLSFREVVQYFKENRPDDSRIVAGALLRQRGNRRTRYVHVFLDDADRPVADGKGVPYGRVVRAAQEDDELAAAFGRSDNDLVVFR